MARSKRRIGVAVIVLVALLSGCSQKSVITTLPQVHSDSVSNQTDESAARDELSTDVVMGIVAPSGASSNPISANERDIVSLNRLVYESLVELDDDMQPTPLLADRWTLSDTHLTFTLRSGIVFHDGSKLTAGDVVASYNAILAAGETGAYYERVSGIREMTAQDDLTLSVVGKYGGYLTLYAMTFPVIEQHSITTGSPMGTGPYWYIQNDVDASIRLERNPLWWKRRPEIAGVTAIRYDTAEDALAAFELGEINAMATRAGAASLSSKLSDRSTLEYTTLSYECVVPNLANSILADASTRRALMYAMDRSSLASTVYLDMVQETEVPVLPGSWLYEPQSARYNYSPERALSILYGAGWSDSNGDGVLDRIQDNLVQDLSFELITYEEPTSSTRYEAAKLIAEQLGRIGIKLTVRVRSKAEVRTALKNGEFDLALVAYNLSELPDLGFLLGSGEAGNYSRYRSAEMDECIQSVRSAGTGDELSNAMSKLQIMVVDDLPILGLFFRSGLLISKSGLGGLNGIRESQTLRGLEFVRSGQQ